MKTENEVIARLISSTHRQKRPFTILDVAEDIEWLSNRLGSLPKVASRLGISTGMLNQFLRVRKLSPNAQELVKSRQIDSVSVVHNLAKFSIVDQDIITECLSRGQLTYADIRLLSPLRKQFPDESIGNLIQKLKQSANIKVSVIQFPAEYLHRNIDDLRNDLSSITGSSEVVDVALHDGIGAMTLTRKGEQALRQAARRQNKTLRDFTYAMLQ